MTLHALIDQLILKASARLMPGTRYFGRDTASPCMARHLRAIDLRLPAIHGEGLYQVPSLSLVGELDAAFRVAQWRGAGHPTIIYHHGTIENPYDRSFCKIFSKKLDLPLNLIVVRAPFNTSFRAFAHAIGWLENYAAMMAASVQLIEALVAAARRRDTGPVVVSGISLGGFVTNLHHAHFGSADCYAPLLAGAAMDAVLLDTPYHNLVADLHPLERDAVRYALNFEAAYARADLGKTYPLLARHDQYVVYERQRRCYGAAPVTLIDKGHTTGALAFEALRSHLLRVAGVAENGVQPETAVKTRREPLFRKKADWVVE